MSSVQYQFVFYIHLMAIDHPTSPVPTLGVNIRKDFKIGQGLKVSFWSILEGSKRNFRFSSTLDSVPPSTLKFENQHFCIFFQQSHENSISRYMVSLTLTIFFVFFLATERAT